MTPESRRVLGALAAAVLALLLVVALAFAYLPFHVGSATTNGQSTVGKAVAGNATSQFDGPVYLHVDGAYDDRVTNGLAARLEADGHPVRVLDELNGSHDRPVVAVRVTRADVAYSPVSPSATVEWTFAYVASGNGTLADRALRRQPLELRSNGDRYVVDGDVAIQHRATGVYSEPGYRDLLVGEIVDRTTEHLRDATRD